MRPHRRLAGAAHVCALLLMVPAAIASGAERDEADIDRGVKLMDKADFAGALDAFRAAHDRSPTPESLARIGLAEQGLKRWVDAEFHLNTALSRKDDPWIKQYLSFLQEALAEIKKHIGSLDVRGSPYHAMVEVNGEVVGLIPFFRPRKLPVGSYEIKISAPDYEPVTRTVRIDAGEATAVTVSLTPVQALPAPTVVTPSAPPSTPSSPTAKEVWESQRRLAWRVAVVGIAIFAVGAAGFLVASGIALFNGPDSYGVKPIGITGAGVFLAGAGVFSVGLGIVDPGPTPPTPATNHARGLRLTWSF